MSVPTAIIVFAAAASMAWIATPLVARLARRMGVVDRPSERKVSQRLEMPLLGGLAVAAGLVAGLGATWLFGFELGASTRQLVGLGVGGTLLLCVGFLDDKYTLGAPVKFLAQGVAAVVAISCGYRIESFAEPVAGNVWYFAEPFVWIVTALWIIGVTNAINLMDGLDGLASGLSAIIVLTLTWVCFQAGGGFGVILGLALGGALLGFLPRNFHPARIFLGDTGSLFIGFTLALLALEGYRHLALLTFVVPILALAVPLLDTSLSIARRVRKRTSIAAPDRLHMHHRLLAYRGSERAAVLSIYLLTASFCIIAVSFTKLQGVTALVFLVVVVALTLRLLRNLGFLGTEADAASQPVGHGRGS